jgi:hypothetical protein
MAQAIDLGHRNLRQQRHILAASADIVLPTTGGREIRLRRITEPTAEQTALLQQLHLNLPDRLQGDHGCSVDSAIA